MKRTKGVLAMEGLEALTAEPAPLAEISAEIETSAGDLLTKIDNVSEGESIVVAVDTISDSIATSVERGEGLDDVSAGIANAALENFYERLGYTPTLGRDRISMEGLDKAELRLQNSKVALEQIGQFRTKLVQSLAIAHEDMMDSLGGHFNAAEHQLGMLQRRLQSASSAFGHEGKVDELIASGRWAAPFGAFDEEMVSSDDIVKRLRQIQDKINSEHAPFVIVEGMTRMVKEITSELGKAEGSVDDPSGMGEKFKKFHEMVKSVNALTAPREGKDASYQISPVDQKHMGPLLDSAKFFSASVQDLAHSWGKLSAEIEKLEAAADKAAKSQNKDEKYEKGTRGMIIGGLIGTVIFPIVGTLIGAGLGLIHDAGNAKHTPAEKKSAYKDQAPAIKEAAKAALKDLVAIDVASLKIITAITEYIERSTK